VVYNETSELVFYAVVLDKGSPPRGSKVEVRMKLSNTCLITVLYDPITVTTYVEQINGSLSMRIPKYYVYDFREFERKLLHFVLICIKTSIVACDRDTGMDSGFVLDDYVTASSYQTLSYPGRARLNEAYGRPTLFAANILY
jgi:hypothetical protein